VLVFKQARALDSAMLDDVAIWEWGAKGKHNYIRVFLNPNDWKVWGENVGREGKVLWRGNGHLLAIITKMVVLRYNDILHLSGGWGFLKMTKSKLDDNPRIFMIKMDVADIDEHSMGLVEVLFNPKCRIFILNVDAYDTKCVNLVCKARRMQVMLQL
jgi:hypothetical protein